VASADQAPRRDECRNSQRDPRQAEEQIRRHGAIAVTEEVLQRAPGDKGRAAAKQHQNDGCSNTHCTAYPDRGVALRPCWSEAHATLRCQLGRVSLLCGVGAAAVPVATAVAGGAALAAAGAAPGLASTC
jgi:hypothetical protein